MTDFFIRPHFPEITAFRHFMLHKSNIAENLCNFHWLNHNTSLSPIHINPMIRLFLIFISLALPALADKLPSDVVKNTSWEIDAIIQRNNQAKNITANPIIDDATFLRRTYLNIIGRIPTYEECKTFLDDPTDDKRSTLIDQLIYSPGFNSKWFNFYANLLRVQTNQEQFGVGWHLWLREAVATNKPYDKLVYEMLTASGHCTDNPAVGYYLRDSNMLLDNISNTAQIFLGTQIGCAQCHDHPFEDWTQKQYYQLASFGAAIEYNSSHAQRKIQEVLATKNKGKESRSRHQRRRFNQEARDLGSLFRAFRKNEISLNKHKSITLPTDYKYNDGKPGDKVLPAILFGKIPERTTPIPPLTVMARWLTAKENPMFTKVIANRLWAHATGYGLVEPLDNWTERSDLSHPEVLDLLVKILHTTNYDTRETLRVIYHTTLFQRESCREEINDGRMHDFRGPLLRRMSAEEIHDSLLTLELGNIDTAQNRAMKPRWDQLCSQIDKLLKATPAQLIKLDQIADTTEEATRKMRKENQALQAAIAKAKNDGNQQLSIELQRKLTTSQQKTRQLRRNSMKQAANGNAQSMEMMASMMANNQLRIRNRIPLRASELPTPFDPGSLPRDFGASDRNTTNAEHTRASIPQALTMLNGHEIERITDQRGKLADLLKQADSPDQRLDILFLSLYNAIPTKEERTFFAPLLAHPKHIRVLAKAMLTSNRFLFIQ